MNWGKSIVLAFIAFAAIIITMVYISMQHDINLVRKDYYKEELAYQDQIDRVRNYKNLAEKPNLERNGNTLTLSFPDSLARPISGELWLYRPSVSALDRKFPIKLAEGNDLSFPLDGMSKGLWKIKLSWADNAREYFNEQSIVL